MCCYDARAQGAARVAAIAAEASVQHDIAVLERVKDGFSVAALLRARRATREFLTEFERDLVPGIEEAAATALLDRRLRAAGAQLHWHRPLVRIGVNTTKRFAERSEPGVRLRDPDICFVDIGPVWDGYEGDCGETIVVGADPERLRCARDAREIFALLREAWRREALTGRQLYARAAALARERGWLLNRDYDGHRLGDFPHHAYYRGGLSTVEARPAPSLWVLEVQIVHPARTYGAFYEDLLV